ncbi:MAG: hypothetical protein LBH95_07510 [Oscillospiraceae bacterium]|jgi:hypothetical protein|nr:hypothetical protein [Oscillospiraceae bacterium]
MTLNISEGNANVIERGVYYFGLSDYPHITVGDLKNIAAFIRYEKLHGRQTDIVCEDESILTAVHNAVSNPETTEDGVLPEEEDELVYHGTNLRAARKILSSGKLLSAAKISGKTGEELAFEKRGSPWNDPADFFEYIMFCWGDNSTGDYVVLSENFPSEEDLAKGNFNPGVRFYFLYNDLKRHPGHAFDGYHPIKVKDEIMLSECLHSCIVPEQYKNELQSHIPPELAAKVYYLPQNKLSVSDWNEKVWEFVKAL